jgi:hypothetical protein
MSAFGRRLRAERHALLGIFQDPPLRRAPSILLLIFIFWLTISHLANKPLRGMLQLRVEAINGTVKNHTENYLTLHMRPEPSLNCGVKRSGVRVSL